MAELTNFINFSQNLSYLNISNCKIGDDGLMHFCKNIYNFNLIELDLSKNELRDLSGFYLGELLQKLNKLEYLNLAENSLNGGGFTSIINSISTLKTKNFRKLNISNNSLIEIDIRCIVEVLVKYEFLEEFDLSYNSLCPKAANSLGIYLKNCKGLKTFYLNGCNLNEESCPMFIKNLEGSSIKELYLDENPIGQIGGILFANLLKLNKFLSYLSLRKCEITGNVIKILLDNYAGNENYLEIDFKNNFLSEFEKKSYTEDFRIMEESYTNNNNSNIHGKKRSLKILIN